MTNNEFKNLKITKLANGTKSYQIDVGNLSPEEAVTEFNVIHSKLTGSNN